MDLTFEQFAGRVGERFSATALDGRSFDLELREAEERAANPNASQGFSLVFGADELEVLEQQTFEVTHAELGTHAIFLVPIAPGRYEAVFSR